MSAKTDSYHTWKILERIAQTATNAQEAIRMIDNEITTINAIFAEDEETARDMGFGTQRSLFKTVQDLLKK